MDTIQKRTWAEIDLARLEHNYRALRDLTSDGCKFLGVVKANAYGHGAVPVAKKLEELGAEYLAVACLDEATELRAAGITAPILILGVTPPEYAPVLMDLGVTQTVGDLETAGAYAGAAQRAGRTLKVHVKVDTGMSRLGFLCDEAHMGAAAGGIAQLCRLPGLEPEGIFTHFANADGDEAYTMRQFTRFLDVLDKLASQKITFQIRHCAASAAVLNYPCTHLDMIRPGIALYGHFPAPDMEHTCALAPVMTLKTRVAAVRRLPEGTCVSYGCTNTLKHDATLAVLPVGYADGFPRLLSNEGGALIQGRSCPIVGRVCMDMCMVDVGDLEVRPGDEAVLYGDGPLSAEHAAGLAGTISYELLCAVAPRVPRVYSDR